MLGSLIFGAAGGFLGETFAKIWHKGSVVIYCPPYIDNIYLVNKIYAEGECHLEIS